MRCWVGSLFGALGILLAPCLLIVPQLLMGESRGMMLPAHDYVSYTRYIDFFVQQNTGWLWCVVSLVIGVLVLWAVMHGVICEQPAGCVS